ncbi:hypothetical protein [Christiangramia crocea]|uniref:Histone deacetylase n=1 Tax=Christiangramia crocea TaxID=2904124 RepID=A0A9X2A731_9FLAO|nr:hypothetical protein [Gramella crocea]MCG9971132.1 hypothetical protein [Gramella crocea]
MLSNNINDIWYACYGSNIREERFMCYIKGGTPPGAVRNFEGCADKTRPRQSRKIIINREMYFAKESVTWNGGGICFLRPEKDENFETLGRSYLISSGQFRDLVRQELKFEGEILINFERLIKDGYYNCMSDGRYGLLLYLGEMEGKPIVTFTSEKFLKAEINQPNREYLSTIIRGLKEIYQISDDDLESYFRSKKGIKDCGIEKELPEIIMELK